MNIVHNFQVKDGGMWLKQYGSLWVGSGKDPVASKAVAVRVLTVYFSGDVSTELMTPFVSDRGGSAPAHM